MYLQKFEIQNIRSIGRVRWEVPRERAAGWHVIIGDNGSGKSSLLRALALTLVGPSDAMALRQDWGSWLREGESEGKTRVHIAPDDEYDKLSNETAATKPVLPLGLNLRRVETYEIGDGNDGRVVLVELHQIRVKPNPTHHVWGSGAGWFSASYGPFRRFFGGDDEMKKNARPKLARHLSVFGENVALTECIAWLKDLKLRQLEGKPEGELLPRLKKFVNQDDFLPHRTCLKDVSADGVIFEDGNGCPVLVENLSDGYRSILSMTFELIRQLALAYGPGRVFDRDHSRVIAPGAVLIDEIDAHLHPTWQRRVGLWFRKHFPNIQFIVTTHSPLVCQAAEHGIVYRLPRPGADEEGAMVTGNNLHRLLYGDLLDAYDTELFGRDVGRSDAGMVKMQRLAELNVKELDSKLTAREKRERAALRELLPAVADVMEDDE